MATLVDVLLSPFFRDHAAFLHAPRGRVPFSPFAGPFRWSLTIDLANAPSKSFPIFFDSLL
jgi:hypothetical protein